MKTTRRAFMGTVSSMMGLPIVHALSHPLHEGAGKEDRFSCNVYPWTTFFEREGRSWSGDLPASVATFASSGLRNIEPLVREPEELNVLMPLVEANALRMPSIYVDSTLHDPAVVEASHARVLAIAEAAKRVGVRIIVTNPSPLRWGGSEDKTDAQLAHQAVHLDRLGAALHGMGLVLAYHNHDPEMRQSAREFHHMMLATDPVHVRLCLDAHWVYRGAGNSQVALFDIVHLYADRVVELHLRQSSHGVWTEVLGDGDIDYPRLASVLHARGVRPHLVLEQAVERQTPRTLDAVEAHRRSLQYAVEVFAPLLT